MHEYKNAPVTGVYVEDEGDGIITALVSVTGVVDNVKDIIEPGAYKRTLGVRKPKGIWHHSWTDPIAKTLDAKELMPGDPGLPKTLPDGKPWPREAGALRIRMKFNLATDRGKRAYEDVKFFDNEQEWSIGYNVPQGGATKDPKTGIRHIKDIDLFEYSPVLFGAMPLARTMDGVKVAQLAFKDAMGIEHSDLLERIEEWERMSKKDDATEGQQVDGNVEEFEGDEVDEAEDFDEVDALADEFEDDEDEEDEPTKAISPATLRKAIDALTELLDEMGGSDENEPPNEDNTDEKGAPAAFIEAKAMEYHNLTEALDGYQYPIDGTKEMLLNAAAIVFDDAAEKSNTPAMERAASSIMDILEGLDVEADDDDIKRDSLAVVTQVMSDMFEKVSTLKPELKGEPFTSEGQEYKMVPLATRQIGWPVCANGATVSRKVRQRAFLEALEDDDLIDVSDYLSGVPSERGMKRLVDDLLDGRRDLETKRQYSDEEMKALGEKGHAFKNGDGKWAYPVSDSEDLDNAVKAYGRCMPGDKDRLKAYLMKRAKDLNAEDMIPAAWNEKSFVLDMTQLKSWQLDSSTK
jgi:hypothetical protein